VDAEDPDYLSSQLVTYIGNKRALLSLIEEGLAAAGARLGLRRALNVFEPFAGSGAASRLFKSRSRFLAVNDLEPYAEPIARCYLANRSSLDLPSLRAAHADLVDRLRDDRLADGFIAELYAPDCDEAIKPGERAFYTRRNARYIDTARALIGDLDPGLRDFFLAPLLAEASVHANTSGVFKGFHKNRKTGVGQFGGTGSDALSRILSPICLPFPVFSRFECEFESTTLDAVEAARDHASSGREFDVAYLDPPYNQHPYGSNYFMLNLIASYERPGRISPVSGIPVDWRRSAYNRRAEAASAIASLVEATPARFILLSYNSEGFVPPAELRDLLGRFGRVETLSRPYAAFRGSRNLAGRPIRVREYLYVLEKTR